MCSNTAPDNTVNLVPWMNLGLQQVDAEIIRIHELEVRASPLPEVAHSIRELITRFEICHFKAETHVGRIIECIGTMTLHVQPSSIGSAHPKSGDTAWLKDKTGRSRLGQEYIWVMQMWLAGAEYSADARAIPRKLFEDIYRALGERDPRKAKLVTAVIDRILLKKDRPQLPPELGPFWEQVEAIDICHYSFPVNLETILAAIGKLEPARNFMGCCSCDPAMKRMVEDYYHALVGWLQGKPIGPCCQLGERTPIKEWLVACLAKTLKELAGLRERMFQH